MAAPDASVRDRNIFASSASRAVSFTGSPITVYLQLFAAPMLPAKTWPAEIPTPKSISGRRTRMAPSARAVARVAAVGSSIAAQCGRV